MTSIEATLAEAPGQSDTDARIPTRHTQKRKHVQTRANKDARGILCGFRLPSLSTLAHKKCNKPTLYHNNKIPNEREREREREPRVIVSFFHWQ